MQFHTDPNRAATFGSLPNAEVFYRTLPENKADGWRTDDGELYPAGWYWWACYPGCLPDSEAMGPFDSEREAIADARER